MKKIYLFIISITFLSVVQPAFSQDTLDVPLKIRAAIEVSGPAIWFAKKAILTTEGYVSADINEKRSIMAGGGFVDYSYSQYNYSYKSKGFFLRTGFDFNLLSPVKAQGRYQAGIGLHYGLSRYTSEIPFYTIDNYWGTITSSAGRQTGWGHFIEVSPGVKAEIFKNISIGWNISLRMLVYSGSAKDMKPIYIPGFGSGAKRFSTGASYFLTFNIPYKRITVITKPPVPEEVIEEPASPKP